ncbi:MAG: hypothetical protein O2958_11500 [Gemmatimonadetes bacterium]|nr:hypothetical protein [Gemmatimonadota bacterium]
MSLLGLAGIAFRAAEGTLVRRAKRVWYQQPWAQELTRQDVTDWQKEGLARGWPLPEAEHFRLVRFAS